MREALGFVLLAGVGWLLLARPAVAMPHRATVPAPDVEPGEMLAGGGAGGGFATVGERDNQGRPIWEVAKNPGNVRYFAANDWLGQVGEYRGFAVFSAYEYGIRAMAIIISADIRAGKTLRQIIGEYAPPSENDTGHYLRTVSARSGLSPDHVPPMSELKGLLRAMIYMETGRDFGALVARGVSMMDFA